MNDSIDDGFREGVDDGVSKDSEVGVSEGSDDGVNDGIDDEFRDIEHQQLRRYLEDLMYQMLPYPNYKIRHQKISFDTDSMYNTNRFRMWPMNFIRFTNYHTLTMFPSMWLHKHLIISIVMMTTESTRIISKMKIIVRLLSCISSISI